MTERHSSNPDINRREFLSITATVTGAWCLNYLKGQTAGADFKVFLPLVEKDSHASAFVRGICYSPYRNGQNPDTGPHPDENEFRKDIPLLASISNAIRLYGTENNLEKIPGIIQENEPNLKINAGAWLGKDREANERQLSNLVTLVQNYPGIDSVTVGNEVLLRQDLSEAELIVYIRRVKDVVACPVTTAETWWEWKNHRNLAAEADFVLAHFFPYWEPIPIPINQAVPFVKEKYLELKSKYSDKKIVVGETGWPSAGESRGPAVPSVDNQRRFVNELLIWTQTERVDFYYFDAFDENWKKKYEGEVGGHWGLYYSDRTPKHPGLKFI
ncbi:MAG: glycosyl hydrolase family 17 protein [bacterium]|nr:glycosyl hydrolase family 17 protein [bacterium]